MSLETTAPMEALERMLPENDRMTMVIKAIQLSRGSNGGRRRSINELDYETLYVAAYNVLINGHTPKGVTKSMADVLEARGVKPRAMEGWFAALLKTYNQLVVECADKNVALSKHAELGGNAQAMCDMLANRIGAIMIDMTDKATFQSMAVGQQYIVPRLLDSMVNVSKVIQDVKLKAAQEDKIKAALDSSLEDAERNGQGSFTRQEIMLMIDEKAGLTDLGSKSGPKGVAA